MEIHREEKFANHTNLFSEEMFAIFKYFTTTRNAYKIQHLYIYVYICSRTSIIRTPVCHFKVKGVQINEFVRISELSDKIHYLAS